MDGLETASPAIADSHCGDGLFLCRLSIYTFSVKRPVYITAGWSKSVSLRIPIKWTVMANGAIVEKQLLEKTSFEVWIQPLGLNRNHNLYEKVIHTVIANCFPSC